MGCECGGRVEDARAAARRLLGRDRVRRASGAEEEFGRARDRRRAHSQPMMLALGDRQAISVRAQAAGKQRVAVDMEVLRGDRRSHARAGIGDERGGLGGGDRSEEHTSELQSLMRISYASFCLKKKKKHSSIHATRV